MILSAVPPVQGGVVFQTTWGGRNSDVAQSVAIDSSGNIYVTGYTSSFGIGTHLFLLKFDQTGNLTWQRLWQGSQNDFGKGVAVDKSGNVYVVGYTSSFGAGGNDVLLLKFDPSGNLIWQRTWGGASEDLGQGIAIDSSGNIYLTGFTYSTPSAQPNAILLRFNSTGNLVWQRTWGRSSGNLGQGVAVDSGGNVYVTGSTLTSKTGNMDAFILKFTAGGALSWQETWNGTGSDSAGYGVAVDPYNNSYVTGYTQSFGAGGDDAFIIKLGPAGNLIWQKTWGGSETDIGQAISIDILGYIYVAGTSQSFNPGHSNVFLLDLDGGGGLRWETVWGGSGSDAAYGVTAAPSGYGIVTGYVSETGYSTYAGNRTLGQPDKVALNVKAASFGVDTPTFKAGIPGVTVSTPSGGTTYGGSQDAFILKYGLPTPPSAPQNLTSKAYVGYVSLTWNPPAFNGFSSIAGYNVYRSTSSGGEVILTTLGNVTAYNDVGLRGGITYYYLVTALNDHGESPTSNEASAKPTSVPSEPRSLIATPSIQTVQLNWTAPSSTGGSLIMGYNVYRGTASGGESLIASIGVSTTYVDNPLTGGVTYYYRVTAVNILGESAFSNEVGALPTSKASPPQNVQAIPSAGKIILAWNAPAANGGTPITGYNIYRSTFSGGEQRLAQLQVQYSFTDTPPDNTTTFFYTVTAVNNVGESAPSLEVNAKASSSANVPSAPRSLTAAAGKNSVLLSWTAPLSNGGNSISGYDVLRGSSPSNVGQSFVLPIANVTSFNDTSATAGATYFYEVAARNSLGEGSLSNLVNAKPFTTPSAPLNFQAYPSLNKTVLTWTPPTQNGFSPITGYRIYRGTVSGQESFLSVVGNQTYFTDRNVVTGTPYFYNITAVNSAGEGPHSMQASATPSSSPTQPSPPQNLFATGRNGTVILNWTAPVSNGGASLTGYEIWRGGLSGREILVKTVGNVTSFVDTPLQGGVPYYYEVKAINSQPFKSGFSNEAIATPTSTPSVPGNLTAIAGSGKVTLTWTTPMSNGGLAINGYKIYRGTASGTEVLLFKINSSSQLSYIDMSVTGGVTYYYRVTAFNNLGQSNFSNEANATPSTPPPPVNPPGPPSGLTATPGVGNITLTWTPPTDNGGAPVTSYQIFRGTASGSETLISATGSTTFTDTGLTPGTTYYYYVKAVNSAGASMASNEISGTPLAPQNAPSSPQNLKATAGINSVNLTWTAPASNGGATITGYQIYRGTSAGSETLYQTVANVTTYFDQSVTSGITYYYKIKAINSVGSSTLSSEASATPTAPTPPSRFPIIPVAIAALIIVAVGAIGVIFWRRRVSQRLMMPP